MKNSDLFVVKVVEMVGGLARTVMQGKARAV
jgi:hypothetical protein